MSRTTARNFGPRPRRVIAVGIAVTALVAAVATYALVSGPSRATLTQAGPWRSTSAPGPQPTSSASTPHASLTPPGATDPGVPAAGGPDALGIQPAPEGQQATGGSPSDYPAAPTNLAATVADDVVRLQWRDNSHNESGFHIGYSGPAGISSHFVAGGVNATSFQFPPAPPGWSACFAVRAFTTSGSFYFASDWSPSVNSNVCASIPNTPASAPAAPSNVSATLTDGLSVRVRWQDNSSNEEAFSIRATMNGQPMAWVPTAAANVTEFAWTDVWAGPEFCFQVQALSYAVAHSAWSSPACVGTAHLLPAPPSGLGVEVLEDGTVRLTWADNAGNEDGYLVVRDGTLGDRQAPAGATFFEWTGLPPGTSSCFSVRAFNAYARSEAARACTP
jgi:hypothetical protein